MTILDHSDTGKDFATFSREGWIKLPKFVAYARVKEIERNLADLYAMQIGKIAEYVGWHPAGGEPKAVMREVVAAMEERDKEALYQVQKWFPSSELRDLFFCALRDVCCELLDTKRSKLLIDGPALFINMPGVNRLKYRWHSEAHYYPKRRRFLNLWLPVFGKRTLGNGAMRVIPGSHKIEWPFTEYQGFDKDSQGKANHFVQYEVPEPLLKQRMADYYREAVTEADSGDLVIFHRNLIHRSAENHDPDISYALVARAWTPEDDLTLAGRMEATPYGGDVGRPGLKVNFDTGLG